MPPFHHWLLFLASQLTQRPQRSSLCAYTQSWPEPAVVNQRQADAQSRQWEGSGLSIPILQAWGQECLRFQLFWEFGIFAYIWEILRLGPRLNMKFICISHKPCLHSLNVILHIFLIILCMEENLHGVEFSTYNNIMQVLKVASVKPSVVAHTCNPSTLEAEAGFSWIWDPIRSGQPRLQNRIHLKNKN